MPEKPYDKELMIFKEMAMSNSVMVDVITRLLFKKGVCTEEEFSRMLKEVQDEYDAEKQQ
jgi:mannitol/fructose-specific phosphotransferase system IIA component (Ntr-type)